MYQGLGQQVDDSINIPGTMDLSQCRGGSGWRLHGEMPASTATEYKQRQQQQECGFNSSVN